jgi:hypothetical protein
MQLSINRRLFLKTATASFLISQPSFKTWAAGPASAVATDQIKFTTTEKITHSTVFLASQISPSQMQFGTGFIFAFLMGKEKYFPCIVTNKHVLNGMKDCAFELTLTAKDGGPDLTNHVPVTVVDVNKSSMGHPDPNIDLAIIPIWDLINGLVAQNKKPFFAALDASLIPTKSETDTLTPLEDILTAGYPSGVRDNVNNLPVLHRGVTASRPYLDFQGQKQFLIDVAMWPGASGSPVFLYDSGTVYNPRVSNVTFGERTMLLGVARQVFEQDLDLSVQASPNSPQLAASTRVPVNLGVCIKSASILDFEDVFLRRGIQQPDGYQKRILE